VKEALKQLGFRYSPDKKSWYWRSEEDRSSNEKPIPLEMIREKFGSQQVALQQKQKSEVFMLLFVFLIKPRQWISYINSNQANI